MAALSVGPPAPAAQLAGNRRAAFALLTQHGRGDVASHHAAGCRDRIRGMGPTTTDPRYLRR